MKIRTKAMLAGLAMVLGANAVKAQETNLNMPFNIGIYGGAGINMHSPSMSPLLQFDNKTVPTIFTSNSSSLSPYIGLIANYTISDLIVISGRLGYNSLSGKLEQDFKKLDDPITYTHSMQTSLGMFEIQPTVQFHNLLPIKRLYFLAGLEIGIPVSKNYEYQELPLATDPADRIATSDKVDIPDASTRLAIALGAGYVFNLTENIFLSPEVSYHLPLNKVSSNAGWDSWNVSQLRLGVSLTFSFNEKKEKEGTNPAATLDVGFNGVRYYDKAGKPNPLKKITVEETQYAELFPVLPYMFFKEQTVTPTENYSLSANRETGLFSIKELPSDAMEINGRTLDIVGERMKDNKDSKVTFTGTIDTKKETDASLSEKRAMYAKTYLVKNYGIEDNRITITGGKLPAKPSSLRDNEGVEENRRVEISTTNSDLMMPIMIEKDKQRLADPDLIEFLPYANSNEKIKTWNLEIKQSGKTIRKYEGTGTPDSLQWAIVPNELAPSQIPLDYTFFAETESGKSKYASGTVPVDFFSQTRKKTEDKPDRTISKYSLVVFDFDSPEISVQDKSVIDKYVIPAIKFNSTVQIYGYTDRIGDENYNKKLAQQRAENVKKYIESKVKSAKYEAFGVGENQILFDNNNPTGRHLSRTVQVYVVTPKQ